MWLSWLEHYPVNQKVAGSIPGQVHIMKGTSLTSKFLSLSLPFPHSKIVSMSSGEDEQNTKLVSHHRNAIYLTVHY